MHLILVSNLDFCAACRVNSPVLEKVARELNLPIEHLDPEIEMREVGLLSIEALPTTILMRGDQELGRIIGALPEASMRAKIHSMVSL